MIHHPLDHAYGNGEGDTRNHIGEIKVNGKKTLKSVYGVKVNKLLLFFL